MSLGPIPSNKRNDIQALRGYAVLLVVLYHSGLESLRSGFLGVDIFFVISGFLITGLIVRERDAGTFRLSIFYFRRAKRLLPAAYVTLGITTVIAPHFLTEPQFKQFQEQVFGATTFVVNIVLWKQSGYFDTGAITKPLLHFWSLAVEEQYYLLVPCLMILLPARGRLRVICAITAASMIYCLWFASASASAKFYLLHTRAWELGMGSIGALAPITLCRTASVLYWPALVTLMIIPFVVSQGNPPDVSALAVCAATLLVLLGGRRADVIPVRALAFVGDFSYSLYLVHWPIIVFMRSGYFLQQPPALAFVLAFALSFALGYLLYRFVERPVHNAKLLPAPRFIATVIASSLVVLALPVGVQWISKHEVDYANLRRPNYGLAQVCDQAPPFKALSMCSTSERPKMVVWGDSHAMHLLSAIENDDGGVMQATRSACPPFLGIAPFLEGSTVYSREAARSCIEFNASVMRYLETNPSVEIIVLAGALSLFRPNLSQMHRNGEDFSEAQSMAQDVLIAATETITRIRSLGKKVVIVASPPYADFDIGSCLERHARGLWTFGLFADCNFSVERYQIASAPEIQLLKLITTKAKVSAVGFADFLCASGTCQTSPGGIWLYIDGAHLTYGGAEYLGKQMRFSNLLKLAAH